MTSDELSADVIGRIGEFLEQDVTHVQPSSELAAALPGMDSLTLFEMLLYLEDCYGVQFDEQVAKNLTTVEELVLYIAERRTMPKTVS